ncbi:MAG: fibronectin type III domain-containing protein [Opitutae bacterium]
MMSGPRLAKAYVSNYLANDLPSRLITYRNHWGLSSSQLPSPVRYLTYEPFALDKWPTVITMVMNTASVRREGYEVDADPAFRVTYNMRTYIWTRDGGAQVVTEQRDNLTTVVREALMDQPSLSAYDSGVPCYPKLDESTIREEFSDLTLIKGERLLAGGYVSYDLALEETVDHDALGFVQTHENTVSKLPVTPNAPTNVIAVAGDTQITLGWTESTWNGGLYEITGFNIQQSTDSGSTWSTVVADTGNTDLVYTATGLTNGTSYLFRVASVNAAGVGAYSSSSLAKVPTAG